METSREVNLRWNSFEANTKVAWRELREEKVFLDVTLVTGDGRQVQANKVVLSAGSIFFHKIITENPHPHPLIYLKGVSYEHLLSVLDFLYTGEASIAEENLNQFMDVAEDLKIKGLIPTKSHTSSTTISQNQENTEDPGKSAKNSHHHIIISAPLRDQAAAEETSISLTILMSSTPLQNQLVAEEFAPLPRVIREGQDDINYVKKEICDAARDNVFNGMKRLHDFPESFEQCEEYQNESVGLSGKQEHDDHIFSKKPKIEIMNSDENNTMISDWKEGDYFDKEEMIDSTENEDYVAPSEQIHDWYEYCDENNTMISDGKDGDYFDKEEIMDSTENEDYVAPNGEPNLGRGKCSFCNKTFATSSELENHKMCHTSENPLQCPVCNKVYSSVSNLNQHKWIHSEKQFQCLVCFKRFTQLNSLKRHNMTHTGEKPYQCLLCSKKFSRKDTLDEHMRMKLCSMKL